MALSLSRAAGLACALACTAVMAQTPPPSRASIQAERKRLETAYTVEQAACRERFAVTACVDDVRQRRRLALAVPRAQELALDDAARQQRAEAHRAAVANKQRRSAERPIVAPEPARALRLPPPPAPHVTTPHERAAPTSAEAARRAAASQDRRDKIRAGQERIEARQAEKARLKKPAEPLPVPGP